MPPPRRLERRAAPRSGERRVVGRAISRRRSFHASSARQLREQHRRLQLVEAAVQPARTGSIARLARRSCGAAGRAPRSPSSPVDDRAAVAERAEVLRRVEAERGRVARATRRAGRRSSAPCAWAQSSITSSRRSRASASERVMSGALAVEVDGDDRPRPLGVSARSTLLRVERVASPGRRRRAPGSAPARSIPTTVGTHVFAAVITSSPGATPTASSAIVIASVPEATPTACRGAAVGGERRLERLDLARRGRTGRSSSTRAIAASSSARRRARLARQVEERDGHPPSQ